jgi:hypothetical protein
LALAHLLALGVQFAPGNDRPRRAAAIATGPAG